MKKFDCDFAYTLDGGEEGEIVYENFNADSAVFEVNGLNVHPGSAKDIMVNAQLVAMEINAMLPKMETPRNTQGYEGFYHLCSMEGDVEKATLHYIVRDHSREKQEQRKEVLRQIEQKLNEKYGAGTVILTLQEQYRNMREKIEPCMEIVEWAREAIQDAGVQFLEFPERGGYEWSFVAVPAQREAGVTKQFGMETDGERRCKQLEQQLQNRNALLNHVENSLRQEIVRLRFLVEGKIII